MVGQLGCDVIGSVALKDIKVTVEKRIRIMALTLIHLSYKIIIIFNNLQAGIFTKKHKSN